MVWPQDIAQGLRPRSIREYFGPRPGSERYEHCPRNLFLGPELAGSLMTPEEFDAAEVGDELYDYQLIHGVLVVTPPPAEGERSQNDLLGQLLRNYGDHHPRGAALNYTLTEHTVVTAGNRRRADRVIWAGLGGCQMSAATCRRS